MKGGFIALKKKVNRLLWVVIALGLIVTIFVSLIDFITDFLWFKELSYVGVFLTQLKAQLTMGIPTFIVLALLMFLYLQALKRGYFKKVESDEEPNLKKLRTTEILISVISAGFVAAAIVTSLWWDALQFFNSTEFGVGDPLFGHDIGFYVFKLDFIQRLNEMLIGGVIIFVVATVLYYSTLLSVRTPSMFETVEIDEEEEEELYEYARKYSPEARTGRDKDYPFEGPTIGESIRDAFDGVKNFNMGKAKKKAKKRVDNDNIRTLLSIAQTQIILLGIILFLMVGLNFFLRQYDLLHSSTGVLYGAGFTDVNITLWMLRALAVLAVAAAIFWAVGIKKKKLKTVVLVPVIMLVVGLVGTGAAELVQNFVVSPDEINKEREYLERNIEYTQMAYDLDNVDVKEFAASNTLTADDIANNQETIDNIRINDFEPAERFYNQTQAIRQYYTFNDVDVDRYMLNGEYTQVFLSAREIDETKISQEWLNKHLKYTHGYGVTLSRVDRVTASGQPDMMISGIPPISEVDEITIDRPEIYFGELTNNYVLLKTDEQEFDYPDGSSNVYTTYEGTAGIKMNFMNKLMFSIREENLKMLVATNINSDSVIVINRNIHERVRHIMPYLSYDNDAYIIAADGNLYWIIDAYTTSSNYPYSEPYSELSDVNYIRNSIKVVIDAYNGTTDYYIVDEDDPIALTMQKIYPTLFKDLDEMPESIQAHLRYPNTLFTIQAQAYARYHMEDVDVFYQGEDLWDISSEIYGITEQPMSPNYYIMKLPGETSEEFVNTIPYTPRDKDNMTGIFIARNDGDHYGELVLYQLPKSKVVYGPMQIEAQIDQNTEISKEFSLWNSSGSTYTRGNLFIIPIEDSFIYVEPVYLEATNSSIPEVKRVIVAYNDQIAYEETLDAALAKLFGVSDGSGEGTDTPVTPGITDDPATLTDAEIITLANEAFDNAQSAMQSGNWAMYGEYLNQLESYLNMLAE
ncbi:MAG: UPF0182 family protein [Clostridiales bacterium]|nr:UPF0182 family protein [Clostridiales bacterium]